jgi:glycosyltransferase involved in cell wall biosynthesis
LGLKNNYYIIPNVVDTEVFTLKDNIVHDQFNFLHISSLDQDQKNITGIIRTFKKIYAAHPQSKLTIVGGTEQADLMDAIRKGEPFSETDGVFLHAMKINKALAEVFQRADAFVLFSNYENLPVVMLESFCCGVPVVATRVGDVPEYMNEKNGILIDPKNEVQLLDAMEKIYRDVKNYNPVEIRNEIVSKVSPAVISKQFTDIYKMALFQHPASSIQHSSF